MATLVQRVRGGEATRGTFFNLGSALVAEVCAPSGFDWLLVDLEHGAGGEDTLVGQTLAGAAHGVPVVVRVETAERIRVGHALDLGALDVKFPRLDGVEAVAALDGVDVLFVGPSDRSVSLGIPGQLESPLFQALARVAGAAAATGKAAGILTSDPAMTSWYHDHGFAFVAVASDSALLRLAATNAAQPPSEMRAPT